MKRIVAVFAVVAALFVSVPANAQLKVGVKGGLNVTKVDLHNVGNNIKVDNRTGYFAGLTADIHFPLIGLGADISALYACKDAGYDDNGTLEKKKLEYVEVPVNLTYTIGNSSILSIYAATGPQVAWNIGDRKWELSTLSQEWELKKSEFSWNVGGGFTACSHFRLGYNYNIALGKTADFKVANVVTGKLKNNSHQIFFTYFF